MAYQHILFSVQDAIARLTLNRPDKLNSFTEAMHAEVRDALDQIQNDSSVRVLVITGAGRGFCAGQDLADPCMAMVDGKVLILGMWWSAITSRSSCGLRIYVCQPLPPSTASPLGLV